MAESLFQRGWLVESKTRTGLKFNSNSVFSSLCSQPTDPRLRRLGCALLGADGSNAKRRAAFNFLNVYVLADTIFTSG